MVKSPMVGGRWVSLLVERLSVLREDFTSRSCCGNCEGVKVRGCGGGEM